MVLDQSYEDFQLEYCNVDTSKVVNWSSSSHIKHDHTYCLNNDRGIVTPKRRRLSSMSSVGVFTD
jgi:hypothetical protein